LADFFDDAFEQKNYLIKPDKLSKPENYCQIFKDLIKKRGCERRKIFANSAELDSLNEKRLNDQAFQMEEEIRGCVTFYIFRSLLVSYSQ